MKSYLSALLLVGLIQACTVTATDPSKQSNPNGTDTSSANGSGTNTTLTNSTIIAPDPLEGICSFGNNKNLGCLKFLIGTTNLSIGPFQYDLGVAQFVKEFMVDVANEHSIPVGLNQTLQMSKTLSTFNFFDNFYVSVEGGFTTYPAVNTGYGNLVVDKMSSGNYNVTISKDFELRVVNKNGSLASAYCVTIWSSRQMVVQAGQESASRSPINTFDYKVYNQGCNGQYTSYNNIPVTQNTSSSNASGT